MLLICIECFVRGCPTVYFLKRQENALSVSVVVRYMLQKPATTRSLLVSSTLDVTDHLYCLVTMDDLQAHVLYHGLRPRGMSVKKLQVCK